MKTETALRTALIMSGKYNLPEQLVVSGVDQYGKPVTETVSAVDDVRLDADVQAILAGDMPWPVRTVSSIVVDDRSESV